MQTALNSLLVDPRPTQNAAHQERSSPQKNYIVCRIVLAVCVIAAIAIYGTGNATGQARDVFISVCCIGVAALYFMIFLSTWSRQQWRWRWIAVLGFPATSIALVLSLTGIWLVNRGIWNYPRGMRMTGDTMTAMSVAGAAALICLLLRARLQPPWTPLVRWTCLSTVAWVWMMIHQAKYAWVVGPKDSLVGHLIPGVEFVVAMGAILICLLHSVFAWNRRKRARVS